MADLGGGDAGADLIDYTNVPRTIGHIVSSRLATLHELDSVYSLQDAYLMLEVMRVDAHNRVALSEADSRKRKG